MTNEITIEEVKRLDAAIERLKANQIIWNSSKVTPAVGQIGLVQTFNRPFVKVNKATYMPGYWMLDGGTVIPANEIECWASLPFNLNIERNNDTAPGE